MEVEGRECNSAIQSEEEMMELRRGPWTVEEDMTLMNFIAKHGEGRWNSLARCAGLKRTGKSCRLRWLNYLRPDVRRGNITPEEQLLILELHCRWGNRWSKIAQHLPGRTDNEIKNYWRTRVQKHAKQLQCDVNSKQFKDTMRYLWIPRLVERIQASSTPTATGSSSTTSTTTYHHHHPNNISMRSGQVVPPPPPPTTSIGGDYGGVQPENSSTGASSDSFGTQVSPVSDLTDYYNYPVNNNHNQDYYQVNQVSYPDSLTSPSGYFNHGLDFQAMEQNNNQWFDAGGDTSDNLWNVEDIWFLQQQLNNNI
ncbi:hypothetical protein CsSME_00021379 [Camellia sinensis var. sinensis]